MKEQIIELNRQGKTNSEIAKELNCSKSNVSYHLNQKTRDAAKKHKLESPTTKLIGKTNRFTSKLRMATSDFSRGSKRDKQSTTSFGYKDVISKNGENTVCYLTGRPINLFVDDFQFDHIIPASKGGSNELDNLGITCKAANMAKSDLSVDELLDLCKEIITYNGYTITKA